MSQRACNIVSFALTIHNVLYLKRRVARSIKLDFTDVVICYQSGFLRMRFTLNQSAGPSLVWVLWELQHPWFLKVWVQAPMVFGEICHKSINFHKKVMVTFSYVVILWEKLRSSTCSLKFLTMSLECVQLHQQVSRRANFAPTDFQEYSFSTLHFYIKQITNNSPLPLENLQCTMI